MSDAETPRRPSGDPSREMRRSRAIQRVRWLLLLATLVAVVAVVALYLSGRRDRPRLEELADDIESESMEPTGEMATVGEGFEQTVTEGDRQLFTVRGDRYALNREGVVFLEGVDVIIYREEADGEDGEGEESYRVRGEQARFELDERQGRIAGGVEISAPGGLTLTTESLRVTNDGTQIRTGSPVAFEIGEDYRGTAEEGLRAWIPARRYQLQGLVRIDSREGAEEPLHILAKGLIFDRNRSLMRSRTWAVLRRPGARLSALEMHFFFADDERTLRFVRAERNVSGVVRSGGPIDLGGTGVRRIGFEAGKMTLLMTEDGRHPRTLDLERVGRMRARVHTLGPPAAPRYRLTAPAITASFTSDGTASDVVARRSSRERVVLTMREPGEPGVDEASLGAQPPDEAAEEAGGETPDEIDVPEAGADAAEEAPEPRGPEERRAIADEARALFGPDGELATVEMTGGVLLEDGQVEARGDRGRFDVAEDRAELEGRPAVAIAEQGRMEAPGIAYTRRTGIVHGTGGVRARIDDARESALGGSPLARGEGPVRVEAEQGFLRDEPRTFLFVGDVRAWRGDDLLVADELRGDEAESLLTATGDVRTLWNPEAEDGPAEAGNGPIEVTADRLVYRRAERLLVYSGDESRVKAEQGGRTVTGREITVTLAEEGGLERLVATGDVEVHVPPDADAAEGEAGKHLRGERAVYDPAARTIDVTAAPGGKVVLREGAGNVVEGPRMEYDIEEDRVRVIGREPVPPGPTGAGTP